MELVLFAGVALLLLADLAADSGRSSVAHLFVEAVGAFTAVTGAGFAWRRAIAERDRLQRDVHELRGRLGLATADAARWREEAREALAGLGAAIDKQCDHWGLSHAERAVALLLLKGLSMKEIAEVRGTTDRTARQQANSVYRKADLGGRAELAAFFLEDLLLPSERT